jgi:hypothetical protein
MRKNCRMTSQILRKKIDSRAHTGALLLELPVTVDDKQARGPFLRGQDDDDPNAVTFWASSDYADF